MNQDDTVLTIRQGETKDPTVRYPPQGRLLDVFNSNGDHVLNMYEIHLALGRYDPAATVTQGYDAGAGKEAIRSGDGENEVIWGTITYEGPITVMTRNAMQTHGATLGDVEHNQRARLIFAEYERFANRGELVGAERLDPVNYESVWTDGELTGVLYTGPDEGTV